MAIFHSYVSLPEGKHPFSYGFPIIFPLKPRGCHCRKLTIPIGFLAMASASMAGWLGACSRSDGTMGAEKLGYLGKYFDTDQGGQKRLLP